MGAIFTLLRRSLRTAWRKRWLGVAIAWAMCLVGWIGVSLLPNQYLAGARLYVNTDAVLTPLLKGLAADSAPESQLRVLQATLLSRPNVETLISKTDLDLSVNNAAQRDALVNSLISNISVRPDPHLNVFSIQYSDPNPKLARDVVQALLTIFVENATGGNRRDMENARIFLEHQISSYEQQLRNSESRRAEFLAKYPGVSVVDNGGGGGAGNGQSALQSKILDTRNTLQDKESLDAALKKELASTPPTLPETAIAGPGGTSPLAAAEERLQMMRLQFTDQFPGVIAQQQLVDSLKASPAHGGHGAPGRSPPTPVYESLKLKIVDVDNEIASLKRQLSELEDQQAKFEQMQRERPNLVMEYQNLDRGYAVLRKNYDELLSRLQSANIGEAADTQANQVQIRLIDPPEIPRVPYAPKRLLLVSAVLGIGVIAGLAVPMLLSQLDRSFWVVEDLRSLGLPVLGGISMLVTVSWWRRFMTITSFALAIIVLIGLYGGLMIRLLRSSTAV